MKWRAIREVAWREILTRGRSRGYRGITAIMLLIAVAAPIAFAVLPDATQEAREVTLAVVGEAPADFEEQLTLLAEDLIDFTIVPYDEGTSETIAADLNNGTLDAAYQPPSTILWDRRTDQTVADLITTALQQSEALARAEEMGLSYGDLADVFEPVTVDEVFIDGSSETEGVRSGVAMFGLFLAFLLPQIFGQFTMMSVVEEKQTRVVEVLLSQIRPATLLAGKVLGLCALAVLQLAVIVGGLIASLLATQVFDVPASVWRFVPMFTLSILGGLAIYTTLFALLGSLISRQEDQAQVMFPVFAPLMIGYFVGQTAVFGNAESAIARALTWFPLTSPMMLPVRVAKDAIGPLETAAALALIAITAYALFRLSARIYEFTLLRTGSRVGWREVLSLSRGSALN